MEYYGIEVTCSNCNYEGYIKIPVGQAVNRHPCPVCGCNMLKTLSGTIGYPVTKPKETKEE